MGWLARKKRREALESAARRQQEQWIRLFDGSEMSAIGVLHGLADQASHRYGTTSGDVGVVAFRALSVFDVAGRSGERTKYELIRVYLDGSLRSLTGEPLRDRISESAMVSVAISALLNARPTHRAEIETMMRR